jgi:uncharacterized membrane protein
MNRSCESVSRVEGLIEEGEAFGALHASRSQASNDPHGAAESHVNARLEMFCDGVFAIALTLLVIDLKLPAEGMGDTAALWRALEHMAPTGLAFVLSFGVILITWVNHHAAMKLVRGSSASFIYANGFLLMTVVLVPFPTALLGAFLLTDHAAPAVVVYDAVLAAQAIGWILLGRAALRGRLTRGGRATSRMRENQSHGYRALVLYSSCSVAALRFPLAVAAVTMVTWVVWLVLSVRMRDS